jgi:hypothetical protein
MLFFRLVFGLLLLAGLVCFAIFVATGQPVWRQRGVRIVKWTLIAAFGTGAVILLQYLLPQL